MVKTAREKQESWAGDMGEHVNLGKSVLWWGQSMRQGSESWWGVRCRGWGPVSTSCLFKPCQVVERDAQELGIQGRVVIN